MSAFKRTSSSRVGRRREYEADLIRREKQDLADTIAELKDDGSSLIMNWGEDTGQWECAWITGGIRFVSIGPDLTQTLKACRAKAYTYYGRVQ